MKDPFSDTPQAWKKKGDVCLKEGEYSRAIQYYRKAIELDPGYTQAWNNLGYCYVQSGQKEDAIYCIRKKKELEDLRRDPVEQIRVSGEMSSIPFQEDEIPPARRPREELQPSIDISGRKESGIHDQKTRGMALPEESSQTPGPDEQPENYPPETQEKPDSSDQTMVIPDRQDRAIGNGTEIDQKSTASTPKHEPARFGERMNALWTRKGLPGGNDQGGQFKGTADDFKKVILFSVVVGLCLMVFLLFLGSSGERFTQFYLYPDSIQTGGDSYTNVSSFTYGVKSFEHGDTQYQLRVYAGSELVDMENFSLSPGETREDRKSFNYTGVAMVYPQKINIILESPYQTYDLHYWIKE